MAGATGLISEAEFWQAVDREIGRRPAGAIRAAMPPWAACARPSQKPPPGDWRQWLILGGRGSGKTRAGAEWIRALALGEAPFAAQVHGRIALVAETLGDAREVMVEGESGLRSLDYRTPPVFEATRRRLVFANGAVAQIFSSEDPESLRGYQFDAAWGDELAKWTYAGETFDNLQLALRLGRLPRMVLTTTPRAVPLLKRLLDETGTATTRMRTAENRANLSPGFVEAMERRYGGSRLARQELDGELIEAREDALFSRARIDASRVREAPPLGRIVVAVDPPATGTQRSDACGIVAAGLADDGTVFVLADRSRRAVKPPEWAAAAVSLYRELEADRIVAEVNQGGDMVEAVIRTVAPEVPVRGVRATRGKWLRAEPVAALYEQGRVRHAGLFAELEDELCDFGPDGLSNGRSPDRLDALVWAVSALVQPRAEPRVRGL